MASSVIADPRSAASSGLRVIQSPTRTTHGGRRTLFLSWQKQPAENRRTLADLSGPIGRISSIFSDSALAAQNDREIGRNDDLVIGDDRRLVSRIGFSEEPGHASDCLNHHVGA